MKKRLLSLLLVFVMLCGMLPTVAAAADTTATLTDSFVNYNCTVTFSVSGATVSSYSYVADTNTMSITVADVTSTSVTLTAETTALQFSSQSASVDVSSGTGSALFRIFGQHLQQGETITVNVTVDNSGGSEPEKTLTGISVTTQPTKTEYTAGETFDPTGMVVEATYSDSSTVGVTEYTCSPAGELAATDTKVTVTYEGKTAEVAITVSEPSGGEEPATLTITNDLSEEEVEYNVGDPAGALTVAAEQSKGETVSYQWYSNGTNSTEGATAIEGATSAAYTPSTAEAGTTYYYVVATCGELTATSKIAAVTVNVHVNTLPELKAEATKTVSVYKGDSYTWTMSDLFTDLDEDALIYKVQVYDANGDALGSEIAIEKETYTYTPGDNAEGYSLKFHASDDGGTTWSEAVYTAVIALVVKQEYTIVTGDTDSPNRFLSRITECTLTGPKVLSAEVTDAGKVWNITLAADTNKEAAIAYAIKVAGDNTSKCSVSFNGASGVKVSSNAVSFTGVPDWSDDTAVITFKTLYSNGKTEDRNRTYTLNLSIDDGVNDAPYLKGEAVASHDMRVGETYSLDLGTIFGDKDSMDISYVVSVNGADAVAAEKAYSYIPDAAGTVTLAFTANDGSLTSETYTATLNVRENAAPTLTGEDSGTGEVCQALTYTLDLSTLFSDADGDALTYSYTVNGGEAVSTAASFSYTPAEVGAYTIKITAVDVKGAVSPAYTLTLTATENPAPTLTGEATGTASVNQYSAWTIDLSTLFSDNDGDSLTYTVSIDGADAVSTTASYSLTPDTDGEKTLVFYAKDKAGNVSPAYTVNLTVNYVARTVIETGCVKTSASFDGWLGKIIVTGAEITEYKWRGGSGHDETKDTSHELYVVLDPTTPDDAVLDLSYSSAGKTNQMKYSAAPATATLVDGTAVVTVVTEANRIASWVTKRTYTLHFTNKANTAPAASTAEGTFEAFVSENYEVDLSSVFSDVDSHPMMYTLSVNSGEVASVDSTYSEKLVTPGTYTYVFTATDIWGATATYTVNLTAKISQETYDVTVNVPEGVVPIFYYTEDAQSGTELTAQAAENVYTVKVPTNISTLSWRADGMGMSTAVSAENNSLTLYKTDYVVKAGDDTDANAVVTVKYGEATAVGNGGSFLLLSTGTYTVSAAPSSNYTAAWRSVELTEQAAVSGEAVINLEYRGVGITVPAFAEVRVCAPTTRQGVPTTEIQPDRVDRVEGASTATYYYVLTNGSIYEYRVTVPASNESSDQYVPFVSMFKKMENSSFVVTEAQLEDGDNGRTTVDHEMTPYSSAETLDMANVADLYMNVNAQGYLKLNQGQTKDLYTARSWWATNCGGWAMNTYYFLEPDYTYTVVGLDGQPSTGVITIDENGKITAVGDGTAIVLVTYDAMNVDIENTLYQEAGPESPLNDGFYSAIWPENTGVFVVSVGAEDSGITTGMTINEDKILSNKTAGKNLDAELDVIYFIGEKGEYTFTPGTEGVTVSIANPAINNNVLSFDGFAEVTANADGSVTVPLTAGRNIVKVEKDGKAEYQVITAKSVSVTVNGKPLAEATVAPGDTVTIVFDTLYTPVNRMALYNTGAAVVYSGVSGYPGKTAGNYRGGYGFYFFASNAPHQTVANFNTASTDGSGYNNNQVTLGETLTVPADFAEAYFTLSDGSFSVGGFSKFNMGDHRTAMGQAPNNSGGSDNIISFFGRLPDISIPAATLESIEVTALPAKTTYSIGDVFDPTGMVITATYSNSAGRFTQDIADYAYDTAAFTEAGEKTVTISCGDKTATVIVTVTEVTLEKIEVTVQPTKTMYRIGENFDLTGMVITATYSDNSTREITDYTYAPDVIAKDITAVTVTYGGKSVDVPVTVSLVERLEITTQPTKKNHTEGERFDSAGMVIKAYYTDGSSFETDKYDWSPAGQLSPSDTTITITYNGSEGAASLQPVTVDITVEALQSGGGDGDSGNTPPSYESITVYMTFVNRGSIVVQDTPVVVYDEDRDGTYRIGDAFRALHRDYYSGGESGYAEISGNGVSGWVSKFWGSGDSTFTYARNHRWASSTNNSIYSGDSIAAINGVDSDFFSDLYTWFDSSSYSALTEQNETFTVNGLNLMGSSASYNALHAPAGATVSVYKSGSEISSMRTTVGADGSFTLYFTEAGTYTLKISGTAEWGSYTDAPVAPCTCTVYVRKNPTPEEKPEEKPNETPADTVTPEIEADANGEAKVEIGTDAVTDALKQAADENKQSVVVAPVVKGESNTVTVELPKDAVDQIAKESDLPLTVETPAASVTIPSAALNELAAQSGSTVAISAETVKDESGQATGEVKINITVDSEKLENVGGIAVNIPTEEVSAGSVLVIVHSDGTETVVKKSAAGENGVAALLDGSATVKVVNNSKEFMDVDSESWYADGVDFVSSRELYKGVGNDQFDPTGDMTRGMLVTVLHRLEDEMEHNYGGSFHDVEEDNWYTDAIHWAADHGLVNGYGNGDFGANDEMTREQMITMTFRYLKWLGVDTSARGDLNTFTDSKEISDWAKEAMEWGVGAGIIEGIGDGLVDPEGNATRAQVAVFMQRVIGLMVK